MADVYQILEEIGVQFVRHDHPPVYTCEEADKFRDGIEGAHCKNLFLRDRKGRKHYLVVVESERRVDLKALADALGEAKLSFASEERLMRYLKLEAGSVSPFGLVNDKEREVMLIVDGDLWKWDKMNFHPNVNTATLTVTRSDFEKFIDWWAGEWKVLKI
jgi:Ala-tRNA(Pro) deacylase